MPILFAWIDEKVNSLLESRAVQRYGGDKKKALVEAITAWAEADSLKNVLSEREREVEFLKAEVSKLKAEPQNKPSLNLRKVSFEDIVAQFTEPVIIVKLKKSSGAVRSALDAAFELYQRQVNEVAGDVSKG